MNYLKKVALLGLMLCGAQSVFAQFDPNFKGYYKLQTQFRGNGEALEGNESGSKVMNGAAFMDANQNVTGQMWKLVEDPNNKGFYRLKTKFRGEGECLEGNQIAGKAKKGAAFMDKCQNVTGQLWKIEAAGNGYYRLKTKFQGDGFSLEGNERKGDMGGNAFMNKTANVTGQLWKFTKLN